MIHAWQDADTRQLIHAFNIDPFEDLFYVIIIKSQMPGVRIASVKDNDQLIALIAEAAMPGDIGLLIDRKPDYFALSGIRGSTTVFVAEDNNKIIGTVSVSKQEVFVGGEIVPLHYVGDFRVSTKYQRRGVGMQLCNAMAEYIIERGADLVFLNVSKGNLKPVGFFKNRPEIPDFENIGLFKIFQFIGKRRLKFSSDYPVESTLLTDELLEYFRNASRCYEMGPVAESNCFNGCDNFIIRNQGKIVAAMSLIDLMTVKQNVVTHLSLPMKIVVQLAGIYGNLAGLSAMQVPGQPVKMLYIKRLAAGKNNAGYVKQLVNYARTLVYQKRYCFASIGLHERDPLITAVKGIPNLKFESLGMLVGIKNNRQLVDTVKSGIPFEDYSLV